MASGVTTDDTDDPDDISRSSICARAITGSMESHPWSSVIRGLSFCRLDMPRQQAPDTDKGYTVPFVDNRFPVTFQSIGLSLPAF